MSKPTVLQQAFARGMRRDVSRDQLPAGSVWSIQDYIPGLGAPLRKRGGYSYASADISATKGTAGHVAQGIYAEFATGSKNLALDEDGELYVIVSSSSTTDVGASVAGVQNPVFHREKVIMTASDGTTAPKYYDGTTLGSLAGSPPAGIYACVYKDRTVLGRSSANPTRLWFSGPGDPTTWDTTNSWWDTSHKIKGLVSLRNAIIIFSNGHIERLRGSTPPPGSDMILDPLFDVGCTDAQSIAMWGDQCVFQNPTGVYLTDGAALVDLTTECGVKTYWQSILSGYSTASWTLAGGVYGNYYLWTVMSGSTVVDGGMIDLAKRVFFRVQNVDAVTYWHAAGTSEELYFGRHNAPRVGSVSSMFNPSASVKNDANGTAVTPVLETPFFTDENGAKRWKAVYAQYDVRDSASDNPTLGISYLTSPEATSYTSLSSSLAESTSATQARAYLRFLADGVAFKFAQSNASSDTRFYAVRADVHGREPSRVP